MKRNLVANVFGTAWTGLLTLLLIRLYVQFLGVESYGLLAFYASAVAISTLLDAGLGIAVNREVAFRSAAVHDTRRSRDILRTGETIYGAIGLAMCGAMLLAAPWIAQQWFSPARLSTETVATAVRLMAVAIALRFPYGLYASALLGAQRHVLLNTISTLGMTVRIALTLVLVVAFDADVRTVLAGEIAVVLLQTTAAAVACYRVLPRPAGGARFDTAALRRSWAFVRVLALIGVAAGLVAHTDKLVVSKILPLAVFGAYSAAVAIGGIVAMAVQPLHVTLFPRLTQLVAGGATEEVARVYHRSTQLMAAILFPIAAVAVCFSSELLGLWIDRAIAVEMRGTAALLVAGYAAYAATTLLYALQLAHGWATPTLVLNASAVAVLIPASIWSAMRFGVAGPAATWLIVNVLVLIADAAATHARLLPGHAARWLTRDLAPAIVVAALAGSLSRFAYALARPETPLAAVLWIGATGLVAFVSAGATTEAAHEWLGRRRTRR